MFVIIKIQISRIYEKLQIASVHVKCIEYTKISMQSIQRVPML